MKPVIYKLLLGIIATGFLSAPQALAQCAMCAASVESNQKSAQNSIATSLNSGILYLMILPYILFGTIAFFWVKNARKQKAAALAKGLARARLRAVVQAIEQN